MVMVMVMMMVRNADVLRIDQLRLSGFGGLDQAETFDGVRDRLQEFGVRDGYRDGGLLRLGGRRRKGATRYGGGGGAHEGSGLAVHQSLLQKAA
jgi:hypothetical protein